MNATVFTETRKPLAELSLLKVDPYRIFHVFIVE